MSVYVCVYVPCIMYSMMCNGVKSLIKSAPLYFPDFPRVTPETWGTLESTLHEAHGFERQCSTVHDIF